MALKHTSGIHLLNIITYSYGALVWSGNQCEMSLIILKEYIEEHVFC